MIKDSKILTLAAVGDIFPGGHLGHVILDKGIDKYAEMLRQLFEGCDIIVGNLECPITDNNERRQGQLYNLKLDPKLAPLLQIFDGLALANNHILDYNETGLKNTLDILDDLKIPHCGAGMNNEEAAAPCIILKNGFKIAMLAFTDRNWYPSTDHRAGTNIWNEQSAEQIKALKENVDFVITNQHQGYEFIDYPGPEEFESARQLIGAGSDLVLGHHSHTLFGIREIDHIPVAFGLGNFIFDFLNTNHRKYGINRGFIKFSILDSKIKKWEFVPLIGDQYGWPVVPDSPKSQFIMTHVQKLSNELQDEALVNQKFKKQAGRIMFVHALQSLWLLFKQEGFVAVWKRLHRLRLVDFMVVFTALIRPLRRLFKKENEDLIGS